MIARTTKFLFCTTLLFILSNVSNADDFQITKTDDGVKVTRDGKLLTHYLIKSGAKPILWPLMGPHGNEITRAYPMREAGEHERNDHIHHRSFWFTHGDVNGIDFWSEVEGHGNIIHQDFTTLKSGETGIIETTNDWLGPDGKRHCQDTRKLTFGANRTAYWIDFDTTVTASDGPVKFGDTKEGSFGVRTAGSMKITADLGGTVLNANGDKDGNAWGKSAAWVDYVGPVKDNTVGIAIMNHPSSFRFPTYWHVRTYGLFTANPFGLHHFKGNNNIDGSYTLAKGETMTLRYRVYIHKGTTQEAEIAKQFKLYSSVKK